MMHGLEVPILGRDTEVAALRAWLAAAAAGRGRLVLCSGEPGAGKTRLAAAVAEHARSGGTGIAWGHCLDGDGAVAFRPWLEVLRPLAGDPPPPGLESLLGGQPAGASGPVGDGLPDVESRERAFEAVVRLLRSAGAAGGLLVVLEDMHLADLPSLVLLSYLVRRVASMPVLLVVTYREPGAGSPHAEVLPDLLRAAVTQQITLSGLEPERVGQLLAAVTGRSPRPADTARVHRITGGNPFFVSEIGREWATTGVLGGPVPESVKEAIRTRIARLSPAGQELLRVASIIGDEFTDGLLASVSGRSALVCLPALDEAAAAGLVSQAGPARHRFVHMLVRAAIEEHLTSTDRVRLHARVAQTIERYHAADLTPYLPDLARHWVAAVPATSNGGERAAGWCERAADAALARLAWEEAARLYGTGLAVGDRLDRHTRLRLLLGRARARSRSSELAGALSDSLEAARLAEAAGRTDLVAQAALVLEAVGDPALLAPVRVLCQQALAAPDLPPDVRARLLGQVALACFYLDPDRVDLASDAALAAADTCQDPDAIVAALRAKQLARSGPDGVADRLALADRMSALGDCYHRADLLMWGHLWRIDAYTQQGNLAAVGRDIAGLRQCVPQVGTTAAAYHLARTQTLLAQAEARFADALRFGDQVRAQMGLMHPAFAEPIWLNIQTVIGRHTGLDPDLVTRRDAVQGLPAAAAELQFAGQAAAHATIGAHDRAQASYRRYRPMATWHPPRYLFCQLMTMRVYDAVAIGHREDLAELVERLAPLRGNHIGSGAGGPVYGGPVQLVLGQAERTLGRLDAAAADLRAAWQATKTNGARGYAVEAAVLLAEVLAERNAPGDAAEAAGIADRAATDAEILGMQPWATRADRVAARLPPMATDPGPLTVREQEVAALVARGLTNRAIAQALVISERTAQNHVQHILTKLGFTSRSQIAAWVTSRARSTGTP